MEATNTTIATTIATTNGGAITTTNAADAAAGTVTAPPAERLMRAQMSNQELWALAADLWPQESMLQLAERIVKYEALYTACARLISILLTTRLSKAIKRMKEIVLADMTAAERPVLICIYSLGVYVLATPSACIHLLKVIAGMPGGRDTVRIAPTDAPGEMIIPTFAAFSTTVDERSAIMNILTTYTQRRITHSPPASLYEPVVFTIHGAPVSVASLLDKFIEYHKCVATARPALALYMMPLMPRYQDGLGYYIVDLPREINTAANLLGVGVSTKLQ